MSEPHQEAAEALHHAQVEIARLRGEIEAIKQSPSWRITRPLRSLKGFLKRIAPGRA